MSKRATFHAKSGKESSGELAEPEGSDKAPAIVVLQEWWGLNDHVRSLLDRFAAAGFLAFAPDLFHGTTTKSADEAAQLMGKLDWAGAMDEIAGAAAFLSSHPRGNGKVGVTGFCMGGALAFAAATRVPEFAAVVPFYGVPDPAATDYSKVRAPILAHFATRDGWAKPKLAEQIKAAVTNQGKPMELCLYDADHAFVNDTRPEVYNPEAAKLAWDRTVSFFQKHLAG